MHLPLSLSSRFLTNVGLSEKNDSLCVCERESKLDALYHLAVRHRVALKSATKECVEGY